MIDQRIIELATLSTLEYEQRRDQAAKDMNIRVSVLDRMVRAEQRKSEDASGFSLREVEPWPRCPARGVFLTALTASSRQAQSSGRSSILQASGNCRIVQNVAYYYFSTLTIH